MDAWIAQEHAADIFVVIAKEERRSEALAILEQLRDAGLRVDFPLTAAKVGKQFQTAEQVGAEFAVLVGDEWPEGEDSRRLRHAGRNRSRTRSLRIGFETGKKASNHREHREHRG